jgi:hypothetical protein
MGGVQAGYLVKGCPLMGWFAGREEDVLSRGQVDAHRGGKALHECVSEQIL